MTPPEPASPLALPELRAFLAARLLTTTAVQASSVAIAWQVFAWTRDPLMLGLVGLAQLRAAPAIGAAVVGLGLARRPLERGVGSLLLVSVAVYGAAMVGFGLSRSYPLSLGLLALAGASDMVSVFIRQSLVQLETPDAMRGRVSAVSQLFIGASNELGELESGVAAKWLGVTRAIVLGGAGTIAIVLAWARLFPALRRADRFAAPSG